MSITVEVRFFATLRDRSGVKGATLSVDADSTVADLIRVVGEEFPHTKEALPTALVAINHEYAFPAETIKEGDDIALFPPVSGGTHDHEWPTYTSVTRDQLNLNNLTTQITGPETGAVCVFSGAVRGVTKPSRGSEATNFLQYEAYVPMAEKKLRQVAGEMRERWPLVQGMAIIQRIGQLEVGDTTVLVACASGHRDEGCFEAARYGIDRLKEIVPVWKKEVGPDGNMWVEGHYVPSPDDVPAVVDDDTSVPD